LDPLEPVRLLGLALIHLDVATALGSGFPPGAWPASTGPCS
jgi:hypothetical protein